MVVRPLANVIAKQCIVLCPALSVPLMLCARPELLNSKLHFSYQSLAFIEVLLITLHLTFRNKGVFEIGLP